MLQSYVHYLVLAVSLEMPSHRSYQLRLSVREHARLQVWYLNYLSKMVLDPIKCTIPSGVHNRRGRCRVVSWCNEAVRS